MLSLSFHRFAIGIVLAYPAVLTPAITDEGSDIKATKDEASWIAAAYGITGPLGFVIISAIIQKFGRRCVNILLNLLLFTGWIFIANASSVCILVTGRAIQGVAVGGLFINAIMAAEYSHPKRRGFFIIFKTTTTCLGILMCHSLGFSITWRQMAWLGAIPPAIDGVATIFWPESPYFLAYIGKYDECMAAFQKLRGKSPSAIKEANELIVAQENLKRIKTSEHQNRFTKLKGTLTSKVFLKPFSIVSLLIIAAQACGAHYMLAYVIEIILELTGDKSAAYYLTIGLDVLKTVGVLTSCYTVRVLNRRTLLFVTGGTTCVMLWLICILQYLVAKEMLPQNWVTSILLILYNFICHIGIVPLALLLIAELFSLDHKATGTCLAGVVFSITSTLTVKFTSLMLQKLSVHGTFGVYSGIMVVCYVILYFILPETKDRPLQDIENEFRGVRYGETLVAPDVIKNLM